METMTRNGVWLALKRLSGVSVSLLRGGGVRHMLVMTFIGLWLRFHVETSIMFLVLEGVKYQLGAQLNLDMSDDAALLSAAKAARGCSRRRARRLATAAAASANGSGDVAATKTVRTGSLSRQRWRWQAWRRDAASPAADERGVAA